MDKVPVDVVDLVSQLTVCNLVAAMRGLDFLGAKVSACHVDAAIAALPDELKLKLLNGSRLNIKNYGFDELDSFVDSLIF